MLGLHMDIHLRMFSRRLTRKVRMELRCAMVDSQSSRVKFSGRLLGYPRSLETTNDPIWSNVILFCVTARIFVEGLH